RGRGRCALDLGDPGPRHFGIDTDDRAGMSFVREVGDLDDLARATEVSGIGIDEMLDPVDAATPRPRTDQRDAEAKVLVRSSPTPSHTSAPRGSDRETGQ